MSPPKKEIERNRDIEALMTDKMVLLHRSTSPETSIACPASCPAGEMPRMTTTTDGRIGSPAEAVREAPRISPHEQDVNK